MDHIGQADRSLSVHASARSIELLFVVLLIAFIGICWLPMAALATRAVETPAVTMAIYRPITRVSEGFGFIRSVDQGLAPSRHSCNPLLTCPILLEPTQLPDESDRVTGQRLASPSLSFLKSSSHRSCFQRSGTVNCVVCSEIGQSCG